MKVEFIMQLFDHEITGTIDIPEYDLIAVSEEEKDEFIHNYVENEINNNIQLYVRNV